MGLGAWAGGLGGRRLAAQEAFARAQGQEGDDGQRGCGMGVDGQCLCVWWGRLGCWAGGLWVVQSRGINSKGQSHVCDAGAAVAAETARTAQTSSHWCLTQATDHAAHNGADVGGRTGAVVLGASVGWVVWRHRGRGCRARSAAQAEGAGWARQTNSMRGRSVQARHRPGRTQLVERGAYNDGGSSAQRPWHRGAWSPSASHTHAGAGGAVRGPAGATGGRHGSGSLPTWGWGGRAHDVTTGVAQHAAQRKTVQLSCGVQQALSRPNRLWGSSPCWPAPSAWCRTQRWLQATCRQGASTWHGPLFPARQLFHYVDFGLWTVPRT